MVSFFFFMCVCRVCVKCGSGMLLATARVLVGQVAIPFETLLEMGARNEGGHVCESHTQPQWRG